MNGNGNSNGKQMEMMTFGPNGSPNGRPGSSGGIQSQGNAPPSAPNTQNISGQPAYPSMDFFQTAGQRGGLCAGQNGNTGPIGTFGGEKRPEQIEKENAVQQMRDQGFNVPMSLDSGIVDQIERNMSMKDQGNGEFVTDEQFRRRAGP